MRGTEAKIAEAAPIVSNFGEVPAAPQVPSRRRVR